LLWLARKWEDVLKELTENNVEFYCETTHPAGKVSPSGDLRVARVNQAQGKLKFILLHDRFNR
jgi:hypothetical protein